MFCGRATGGGVFSFGPPQPKHFRENTGFFTKPATGEKNLFLFEGGQNGAIYTHFLYSPPQAKTIWLFFLGGNIYTFWDCFFLGEGGGVQNSAIYTHF